MIEHSLIPQGDIHGIINWEVASIGARDALPVTTADEGKVCHVVGEQRYILVDAAGPTWEPLTTLTTVTADIATAKSEAIAAAESYTDGVAVVVLDDAKDYADALATSSLRDCGNFDASGGAYPSTGGTGVAGAIVKGNMWRITVAGTLPTAVSVSVGDWIRALVDSPGNTQANWAVAESNLGYVPLKSLNGRTTQDAVAAEYILEDLHKLVILASTDCFELTTDSKLAVGTANVDLTYPVTTAYFPDATGIWRWAHNGALGDMSVQVVSNNSVKLSAEPLVLIASFSPEFSLGHARTTLGLYDVSLNGDSSFGGALNNGVCISWGDATGGTGQKNIRSVSGGVVTNTGTVSNVSPVKDTRSTWVIVATSTSVRFYINGALVATHTTNIPTVGLKFGIGYFPEAGGSFYNSGFALDLFQVFRLYKTTPRNLGIPSITY